MRPTREPADEPDGFYRRVLEHVGDAVVTTDSQGRVTFANPAAERLYGISETDARGRPLEELLAAFAGAGGEDLVGVTAALARDGHWYGEIAQQTADGSRLLVEATASLLRDDAGRVVGSVSILREISDRKAFERLTGYQATHDGLTGLLNREGFLAQLREALAAGEAVSLLFVDINGFKAINDGYGHQRGDAVLQAVAGRLAALVRATDLVGRLGGDEFVVLARDLGDAAATEEFLARLTSVFAMPVHCRGGAVHHVGASIGVAHARAGDDTSSLLRRADEAMYEAKHSTEVASAYRIARPEG